jgi:NAD(P)-dependent dehydrogenase (short-subunit alcohol dehydrogenase family)
MITKAPRLGWRTQTACATRQTYRAFHQTPNRTAPPTTLLPEFSLKNKVIVVSGGGRGLGLVQSEALLEAGATVHAIDRLPTPTKDSEFAKVADRAERELGTTLAYHNLDVRDNAALNDAVAGIAERHGGIDGLIAAAGIQQETPALEYSQEDCDRMMGVNVTGVFMTAQAVARQMVGRKRGGSLVLIGSMSGTVANRGLICP